MYSTIAKKLFIPVQFGYSPVMTSTHLRRRSSSRKYSLLLLCLQEVWELLRSRSFSTRRDVFYRHVAAFGGRQSDADAAFTALSALLRVPRLQLRLLATSKGTVAGSLAFVSAQGEEVENTRRKILFGPRLT